MEEYTYMSTGGMLFVCGEEKAWLLGDADADKREKVLKLIKEKAPWKDIKVILDVKKDEKLREWCERANTEGSGISFGRDTIYIDGEPIYGSLCRQIQSMHDEGLPLDPMVNFVRKMRENPSYRIRNQLWGFIEACQEEGGFTIAEDGDIMAYKVVSSDFKDKHTGTFDNSIGAVVEMPRSEVDDDPNNTCSSGLHFCAYSYVNSFSSIGDRLVLVKINPADVVSIPKDYGNAKARCCRYKVVSEINAPLKKTVWKDEEECPVQKKCSGLDLNVGDLIKADLSEYDFECLVKLWNRESGWNPNSHNSSSGAHGIPQSLPASKMASEGADYYTNGYTQIRWGLKYIKGRYGSPSAAWAHSQRTGWY